MFTATSQRGALASPVAKRSIRVCACGSSLTTTTGFSPLIVRSSVAGGARVGAVVAEHEPGGVGDHRARLEQQRVGVAQHLRQQRRGRVDRRAQPPRVVGRVELVGERRDRLLRIHAPAQRRVQQPERERAADARRGPPRRSRRRSRARSGARRRSARTGSRARPTGTACRTARAGASRRRTPPAARCPSSPTRPRDGSRRAPRTSAARGDGRTGPARTRPADR